MGQQESGFWAGERDGLVGRDETLVTLRDLLDSGGRTAVVTGIAGAGKTSVLEVVARAEAADGRLVLPATCHISDRDLAFGVLVDLLMLAPGAESVLEMVVPTTARAEPVDALRLRLEVLAYLEQLGEERPVVVVLDDAQWCDDSSLSVLGFVSRRLTGSSVSVIAAVRGDAVPDPLARHPVVALAALSDRDATVMLRRAGIDLDFLALPEVLERGAGNPLALLELGRMAATGDRRESAPSSVEAAFAQQVAALPAATRDVLLLAAAGVAELPVLGRATSSGRLLADLAPAESAGLVSIVERTVRFRHPLVRSAIYSAASAVDRQEAHARLATAYADDPERGAWHRAEATVLPDEEVAAALEAAADLAKRRGASSEAARLMVRASELSADRPERERRLLQAVLIHGAAGHFDWASRVGSQLRTAGDPWVRAYAAHYAAYALAQTEHFSEARRLLVDVLAQLRDVDPFLGWMSLTTLAVLSYRAGWNSDEVAKWLEVYERATEQYPPDQVSPLVPVARGWVRMQLDPTSRPAELVALVREAPLLDPDLIDLSSGYEMLLGATAWLLDEPIVAIERLERSLAIMRRADRPGEMTAALSARSRSRSSPSATTTPSNGPASSRSTSPTPATRPPR